MASKSKKRSKRRVSVNPLDLVRRNFERGDFKQALKDGRVTYRDNPTPELRTLLEHVYMARSQQLARQGLREDARRIVQELLDLGVTEQSVTAGLPDLLLSVGMLDRLPAGQDGLSDEERERLQVKIVDQAVLRPQDTPQGVTEVRLDAQRIRAALEAVEQGDDTAAAEELKSIPRQSLFADWKFFVRGLMAYYREDESAMLANWQRLDENRAAVRIAAPLKCMAGVNAAKKGSRLAAKVDKLQRQTTSHPVLGPLAKLQEFTANHQWRQALRTLQTAGSQLRKQDPDSYRRVVEWLCTELVHGGQVDELDRLARFADAPPIDPRWNRARAAVREHADEWGGEQYWRKYLRDLEDVTVFPPSERDLARGMVHLHLATADADDAEGLRNCGCGADHSPEIEDAEANALEHFNQCLSLAPNFRPGYLRLAEFHADADRTQQAMEVYERFLEHDPNDTETLLLLSEHYLDCDELVKASEFAERARKTKPLDKAVGLQLWQCRVKGARHFACQGQFDRARDELAAADRLEPNRKDDYDMLARRAVLETKAGRADVARTLIEKAQETLLEPTTLWLKMAIESTRFELPNKETWLYEKRWQTALKRRCQSETAGLMCKLLTAHKMVPQAYDGCDQHVQDLLKYVRRCSRVKWQSEDLREVCEFLECTDEIDLLGKFAKKGLQKFAREAYPYWYSARVEIEKGPARCDCLKALKWVQEAIRLGTPSDNPRDKAIVKLAKQAESLLKDTSAGGYHRNYDYDYDDCEDDYGDDSGEFDELFDQLALLPRNVVVAMVKDFCRQSGLDPEFVMAEVDRRQAARSRRN